MWAKLSCRPTPQPQLKESAAIRLKRLQAVQACSRAQTANLQQTLVLLPHKTKAAPAWTRINPAGSRGALNGNHTADRLHYCAHVLYIKKSWSGSSQPVILARPQWEEPAEPSGESVPGDGPSSAAHVPRAAQLPICERQSRHA